MRRLSSEITVVVFQLSSRPEYRRRLGSSKMTAVVLQPSLSPSLNSGKTNKRSMRGFSVEPNHWSTELMQHIPSDDLNRRFFVINVEYPTHEGLTFCAALSKVRISPHSSRRDLRNDTHVQRHYSSAVVYRRSEFQHVIGGCRFYDTAVQQTVSASVKESMRVFCANLHPFCQKDETADTSEWLQIQVENLPFDVSAVPNKRAKTQEARRKQKPSDLARNLSARLAVSKRVTRFWAPHYSKTLNHPLPILMFHPY